MTTKTRARTKTIPTATNPQTSEDTMTSQIKAKTPSRTVSATRDSNAGLATLVQEVSALLDTAEARLGPESPSLTGIQKRRAAKPRKGAEKILSTLAPIVQQHGLESPSLNAATMMSRLADAQTLQPLQTRLQKLLKRIDDELFSAHGDAWGMGLQLYSLVKNRAKSSGDLAKSIEPLTAMFSYRHPLIHGQRPTKVQTRAKAQLRSALELATRHEVAGARGIGTPLPQPAPSAVPGGSAGSLTPPTVSVPTAPVGATSAPAPAVSGASGSAGGVIAGTHS